MQEESGKTDGVAIAADLPVDGQRWDGRPQPGQMPNVAREVRRRVVSLGDIAARVRTAFAWPCKRPQSRREAGWSAKGPCSPEEHLVNFHSRGQFCQGRFPSNPTQLGRFEVFEPIHHVR
jgi:hypothetical protein